MKAIRVNQFGGPEVLKLEDVPDPKPAEGQVLVRAKAIGVNPVETYIRSGNYGRAATPPYTPGSDAAGVVEAVGPGVRSVKPGDRAYTAGTVSGAYAELILAKEDQVHPLPEQVSFQQGAAVGVPYATAYRAMFLRTRTEPAETLLVHGASGGVGTAAVQLGAARGICVIGTAGTEQGLRLVREQGAAHVLNHKQPDYLRQLMDLTGGKGVDVILEMLANVNLDKDLGLLAPHGRVVVIGNRGRVEIDARQTMAKDSSILGMSGANATPEERKVIHAALVAGLRNGTLKPVIGKQFPLPDAPKAHEAVLAPGSYGKIVLIP